MANGTPKVEGSVRVSLAMIARDDADVIGRSLASAAPVCDELIVVDTGSTDATRAIAERHGATVYEVPWKDDFSAARNESFQRCSGDWILWLDPEDVVPESSQRALVILKRELTPDIDGVFCPFHDRFGDDGRPRLTFIRERFLRRAAGRRWEGQAYEQVSVAPDRTMLFEGFVIEHRPSAEREARDMDRRVTIVSEKVAASDRSPRMLVFFANELMYHQRFFEASEAYSQYLDAESRGEHRYWAQLSRAECLLVIGDHDGGREALLQAIGEDPSRAEAYVALGRRHFAADEWPETLPLMRAATAATRPRFGFMREPDYSYAPWDYLSVCYERLERMSEALEAAQHGLSGNPEGARVRSNMHWIVDRL